MISLGRYLRLDIKCIPKLNKINKNVKRSTSKVKLYKNLHFQHKRYYHQEKNEDIQIMPNNEASNELDISNIESFREVIRNLIADSSIPVTWWSLPIYETVSILWDADIPIWVAITSATIALRVLSIPFHIYQLRNMSKFNLLYGRIFRYEAQLKQSKRMNDHVAEKYWKDYLNTFYRFNKISKLKNFASLAFIAPSFAILALCVRFVSYYLPVLFKDGPLWLHDLTIADPTHTLPVIYFVLQILIAYNMIPKQNGIINGIKAISKPKLTIFMIYILIATSVIYNLPSVFSCIWVPSMMFTLFLNIIFKSPSVKRLFNIPQNIPQKPEVVVVEKKKMSI